MNVAIYGSNLFARTLQDIIVRGYNPLSKAAGAEAMTVAAYIDEDTADKTVDGIPVLHLEQARWFFQNHLLDTLIFPAENYSGQKNFLWEIHFMNVDFENIYIAHRLNDDLADEHTILNMFSKYYSYSFLPYMEYHIADHCNLNCAACEHYSGLVTEPHFPDFVQFEHDLLRLKELIAGIGVIRILGGEPLLNKEIEKYVKLTRKIYPESVIYIVTNGLLLTKMPDSFFRTLRENAVHIWVSFYRPLENKIGDIFHFLDTKGVSAMSSEMNRTFTKKQRLIPQDDENKERAFWNCYQHSCNNLYEGKLAACFLPFTTKYFNKYFNKNIPEDGAIDLYDNQLTTEKLKRRLTEPFERCRFCYLPAETVDWQVMHRPSVISDWTMTK